ncbi:MAG TPA: serine/threonine-protein kinase [Thermoanaerobaculia bacterium]|nr:serine/threonine-protein kinase [Thermoanaerobaculia bacterium]
MASTELICLRCKTPLEANADTCPQCQEKVTEFQRTYSTKLLDGKYQMLDRLGVGGMGEIFKVRHIHLGEQRVIKIMRANIAADEQALQRFLYEAKLATTVNHRNLAMLYDFSTLEDGSYYMVWEFIDGVNIQRWIAKNGPVPSRLAVEMAIQALGGLGALHEMGIIHRDISPENIMLSQDRQGRLMVKVIDFGIAKQLSENEGGSGQGLTQTGMFLGKLKYASPEQAGFIREGEHLDARSDLYSFGIVLYEMLAGKAPFTASNPQSYILKHATEKPLPISQLNPNVTVDPQLEKIVLRTLEKDRNARHASCADLIADLESIRKSIAPEEKFGLGEKMITLSESPTLLDARQAITGAPTSSTRPAATLVGDEPTRIEQGASATLIERGSDAAPTRLETIAGGAAPTAVESRWDSGAAPTELAAKAGFAAKKKTAVWIGAAAAAVLVAGISGTMLLNKGTDDVGADPSIASMTTGTAGSTSTAPDFQTALVYAGIGPESGLASIENMETKKPVLLSAEHRQGPVWIPLDPGNYLVTRKDAQGKEIQETVTVEAGKVARLNPGPPGLDLDKVVDDILKQ